MTAPLIDAARELLPAIPLAFLLVWGPIYLIHRIRNGPERVRRAREKLENQA